jgi:uncharacterized membrane protein
MTVLCAVAAFYFYLEKVTQWKIFQYFPPLIWIYATPVILNNTGVIPGSSPAYDGLRAYGLPMFIVLMLLYVNVPAAVRIMGKGVLVMLMGTAGVVIGGVAAYAIVHPWLEPNAWTGFGALAGSWIGGTGNMAAAAEALGTPPEQFGLAVLADNLVYVVWLPLLLTSKSFADRFNAWARVPPERLLMMESAAEAEDTEERKLVFQDTIYLALLALAVTWIGYELAAVMPELPARTEDVTPILTESTWRILIITTVALLLSITRLRNIPGGQVMATGLIYVFVAGMGARASLAGLDQAPVFVLGAFIWIFIHGGFCLFGAWLFKVDVHSTAIASAANIGGAASAPVVAAYHRQSLVPVSILMALIGYALGNYLAIVTGQLAHWVGG